MIVYIYIVYDSNYKSEKEGITWTRVEQQDLKH